MKRLLLLLAAVALPALVSSCGLFGNSDEQAIVGGGAIAGKDYVCGLQPSDNARDFFNSLSDDAPIETVRRTDGKESKSGVRFVNNGGILIPPGVMISFENKGYCLDPNLPAPKDGDEYQLVPMKKLIPVDMQDTYRKLLTRSPRKIVNENQIHSGAEAEEYINTLRNEYTIQHIIWALRTAGVDAAYADNLTEQQKRILDSCSEYEGQFEVFHSKAKANNKFKLSLIDFLDSFGSISIGPIVYKPSDLLDPVGGAQKIGDHLNALIELGESLPSEHTGFNYGEIEPGIYTDVKGTGSLSFSAKIANDSEFEFIFYPSDYVGQVGSGTNGKTAFFAGSSSGEFQRVTTGNPSSINACKTSSGKEETVHVDYKKTTTYNSEADARKAFEKKARELGARDDCTEVHAAIYKDSNGQYHLTDPVVSHQQTTRNSDGTYSSNNKVARHNIPYDAEKIINIHTHYGDASHNQASTPDKQSKKSFQNVLKTRGSKADYGAEIYNDETGTWTKY